MAVDAAGAKKLGLTNGARADALVFATNAPAVREANVAGKHVVAAGRHPQEDVLAARFADVMGELW